MQKLKTFFDENKVFIIGLAGAILLAVQQISMEPTIDWKVLGLAVGVAAISYIAKNWRGQSMSLIGVIGNIAAAFVTVWDTGKFSWPQFIMQIALVFGFSALPDPKSRGYEQTDTIKNAKIEGEIITPAAMTNKEIKKEAQNEIELNK